MMSEAGRQFICSPPPVPRRVGLEDSLDFLLELPLPAPPPPALDFFDSFLDLRLRVCIVSLQSDFGLATWRE